MKVHTIVRSIFAALSALTLAAPVAQASVVLDVRPVQPMLEASDRPQRTTLKISLEGIAAPSTADRGPVNMVLVLDRSGSMQGDKIENLKRAALSVVDRMSSRDVISVVAYDTREEVLIPAMPVRDKETLRRKILGIRADGSTALFAGVSKGLAQARIYRGGGRATRLVLLSDGQANIGPSSPSELAALGRSAAKEGIPVTTVGLGLGYNEDLMQQLAQASDGNHDFAAEPTDLVRIFDREFGDAQDVVANDIVVKFHCPDNVRLIRVIDQDAEISGQNLTMRWNQLAGGQKRYILVEVELPAGTEGSRFSLGSAKASLKDRKTGSSSELSGAAEVGYTRNREVVLASVDKMAKASMIRALANENERKAVELRDAGNKPAAQAMLRSNAAVLNEAAKELQDESLKAEAAQSSVSAAQIDDERAWGAQRKDMTAKQAKKSRQMK